MPGSSRKRPTTRRSRAAEPDLRPVGEDGSKPPLLDLKLKRKLMIIALANIIPIVFFVVVFFGWMMGRITFSVDENYLAAVLVVVLAAMVLVGMCWWVLFPFSVWLREYPSWYYKHESKVVWALPMAMGWVAWFGLWVTCVGLSLFALWLVAVGLWSLFTHQA